MTELIVYPGSFDPLTNGHLDIIERASKIFPGVLVAIAEHSINKQPLFTSEERENMAREATRQYANVQVCRFSGLLADFSAARNIRLILRSFRGLVDMEYELGLAHTNLTLNPNLETIFLMPKQNYCAVSSSMVKEVASLGGDISALVPNTIAAALKNKFCTRGRTVRR